MRLKHAKLLLNLGNPLQLILKDFNHSREIMRFLRQEALSCFETAGIDCANQSESEARFGLVKPETVANAPRGGSSTWQSVARGQTQIETPYLNGEICLIGRENNIATPANDRIATLALKATNQADFRQQASSTLLEEIERDS
jgi:2-dehydropantoate 2-reductase